MKQRWKNKFILRKNAGFFKKIYAGHPVQYL